MLPTALCITKNNLQPEGDTVDDPDYNAHCNPD
jgi:hypothetical protein